MSRRRWAVRVVTALLAAAAVPVATAGAARAAVSGIDLVDTSVTLPANTSYVVPMACRFPGWTAVSGGWHFLSGSQLSSLAIRQSRPSSSRGWTFTFANTSSIPQPVILRITCVRDLVDPVSVTTAQASIPSGTSDAAIATCPAGTAVLGGGFSVDGFGHNQIVPLWSVPVTAPQGWLGYFQNNGPATTTTTYAVCGKVTTHYINIVPASVNAGKEAVLDVGCGQDYLSSGGWQHNLSAYGPLRTALSHTSRTWRTTVKAPSSSPVHILAHAVCIRLA
jgi:hypothetical protein